MASDEPGSTPFNRARVIGGLLLLALVAVLYVLDVLSPDFSLDTIQLGLILGSALLLLGVEGGKWLLRS